MIRSIVLLTLFTFSAQASFADANEDIEAVINKTMPFAEEFLQDYGEFYPFGGVLKVDGEIVTISGTDGLEENPSANDVMEVLEDTLRIGAENKQYKATAIFYKVTVTPPGKSELTDAVAIRTDHLEGLSMILVFPYTLANNEVTFGELFAQGGTRDIFKTSATDTAEQEAP